MSHKPATPQLRRAIILTIIAMFVIMGSLPMILAQATTPTPSAHPTTAVPTTPSGTTAVPPSGLKIQIDKGNGVDNTQETGFNFLVKNTGSSAISNISVRIYFTTDGSNAASGYVLEKYYDQSNIATVSGPTLSSGSTYYFTVSYGTATLAAGAQWEFQTALHLSTWASTYSGANDYYHTGNAVGALPASYTDTNYIPGYVNGTLAWGAAPGGPTPTNTVTNTFVPPTTVVPPTTIVPTTTTPSITPTGALPDLTVTKITNFTTCNGILASTVTVSNIGNATANSFWVSFGAVGSSNPQTQAVGGLTAGLSTTLNFNGVSGSVIATADSTSIIAESNENNNSLTTTVAGATPGSTCTPTAPPLADLVISGLSPQVNTCQGTVTFQVQISNNGIGGAGTFSVEGVQQNNSSNSQTVSLNGNPISIPAGGSVTDTMTLALGSPLPVTYVFTADVSNAVPESNENNNTASTTITTVPAMPCPTGGTPSITPTSPLPDLVVSSLTAQPNACNGTTTLQIQVSNIGNAAVGSFVVAAVEQNNPSDSQSFSESLAAGGSVNLTVTLALGTLPNTYVVTADPANTVQESNENNNTASVTISSIMSPMSCPTAPTVTVTSTLTRTPTGPLPDLVVMSIFFEGSQNPCLSAPYDQVTIANNGTADATGSFQVSFNGLTQTVNGLAAGQSLALKFNTLAGNGTVATVDSTNVIVEINENNNSLAATSLPFLTATAVGTTCPTITPTGGALPDLTITAAGSNSPTCTNPNGSSVVTIANIGNANAGTFILRTAPGGDTTVNGLATGQSTTLTLAWINGSFTATVDATNLITESNENNNTYSVMQPTVTVTPIGGLCTKTPTPTGVTNTPTITLTPSKTLTPTMPTITLTPTKTNTPNANDPCANPTVITGGGSYTVSGTTCLKYVNSTFKFGGMYSVMNGSSTTVSNTLKWYGGLDQNVTACASQSSTLNGNGAQLNNFTVAKDSTGAMYLTITTNTANTVSISIQNWQNGAGCSVAPTPVGMAGPSNTPTTTATITPSSVVTVTVTKTPSPTPSPTFITGS